MKVYLLILVSLMVCGCTGMQWYKGAMIQYKEVKQEDDTYIIQILGSLPHSKEDLDSAIIDKGKELCGGEVEFIDSKLGTYKSYVSGGGLVSTNSNPEVTGRVKCKDA